MDKEDLPLKKKILDEAKKTGFLLEIDVQESFDKKGWFTRPNARFLTEDGEVEIDLLTHKTISNKDRTGFDSISVICSCKKSESNPWVFYLIKRHIWDRISQILKFTSTYGTIGKSPSVTQAKIYWLNENININNLNINNFKLRGKTYYVAFADPKNIKGKQIYEAITKIIKYLKYHLDEERESNKRITAQKINTIYLPIIVLEGLLFGITKRKGDANIEEEKFIPLVIETGDPRLDRLLIYIVKKDHLGSFISTLEEDLKLFNKKINLFI